MKKKIPNFLSNSRLEVSNSTYKNNDLIIGDTEKVLDIKNQYLFETYFTTSDEFLVIKQINKIKDLACAKIIGEEYDDYCDFTIYPSIDIKIKGSGIRDILQKNNHPPTGFFCIHNSTDIHRRDFDISETFFKFTKKKYHTKSIKISSRSICFAPMFDMDLVRPFDQPIKPDGKKDIKSFEEFDSDKIKLFQKELDKIKKKKNKKSEPNQIVKYFVDNGTYDVYNPIHNGDKLIFVLKK